ncbi:hypothetical protein SK128_000762 [Halocaridina rubra]|uniref:Uncharacterized protein n=1 Tax=Halocaridina rubra TaxID=373956 RepID=A0AAN8XUU3_HALRR
MVFDNENFGIFVLHKSTPPTTLHGRTYTHQGTLKQLLADDITHNYCNLFPIAYPTPASASTVYIHTQLTRHSMQALNDNTAACTTSQRPSFQIQPSL